MSKALQMSYELEVKAKALGFSLTPHAAEMRRLHEANQAMLESLREVVAWLELGDHESPMYNKACAAIAKGEAK